MDYEQPAIQQLIFNISLNNAQRHSGFCSFNPGDLALCQVIIRCDSTLNAMVLPLSTLWR
jgi:hypothetical protein